MAAHETPGLHRLVEAQARRAADAVAVVCGSRRLSYGELDAAASRLAERLRALGVGPDDLVGVHVGRNTGLPVALLGVLKAGAGYVPLATDLPPARLAALITDTGMRAVVTTARLRPQLPPAPHAVLLLDTPGPPGAPSTPSASGAPNFRHTRAYAASGTAETRHTPAYGEVEAAAYVIYTSGSTGAPKGVLVPHGAAVAHIEAMVREFGLGPGDGVLQMAGESFDVATEQLFAGLAAGATVVLRDDRPWGPAEVLDVLRTGTVTVADLPTALFCELAAGGAAELGALRLLVVGGEALPSAALARWLATTGDRGPRVINAYGPTETVMTATVHACTAGTTGESWAPIGERVGPRELYVLDGELAPAENGELYIGGDALARGYLGRPDLTAERFVPDPHGHPGARMYRTGDRVRRGPSGLEFLGRVDDQIKIRGYRVELGEIEHVLAAYPGIRQAAVVARCDRLAAYLVATDRSHRPALSELRDWLADRLPSWMVPGTWLWLDRLPVRPSGKVDRAALPVGGERVAASTAPVAPRTEQERRLAGAFARVLGLPEIGVHDDFFALGGTSLLAARVLAEVRAELGSAPPLHTMYEARTVAALAASVETARSGGAGSLPPIERRADAGTEAPLSLMQEQIWFLEQLQPGNIAYNAPTTFRLHGDLDVDLLERAISEIVRRHEILRTTVHSRDGRAVQVVHPPYRVRVPVVDLRGTDDPCAAAERLVTEEIRTPFALTELPLLRWTLLRLADAEHELVLVEHHLVHDGWTFALLVGELTRLYDAFAAGRPSPLPEPRLQYADFARWQHEVIDGSPMAEQLRYWTGRLAGAPDGIDLPYDRNRAAGEQFTGATHRIELPQPLCAAAREFSRREGVTLFVTMLSAYLTMLNRFTGQDELCVGSAYGNRAMPGTEDMPGMFVNPVVLRCELDQRQSFHQLVRAVHRVAVDAQANQELPFVRLVRELAPPRTPGRNPLYQVMFNFDDAPIARMRFAGITGGVLERFNGTAKLDLGVLVIPRAERQVGLADEERDRRITMVWEYRSDLFDAATVRRFADAFAEILAAAVADPQRRLADLPAGAAPLVPAAPRPLGAGAAPLVPAGAPPVDGDAALVPELFERRAAATPDAEAVCHPGVGSLTYGELDRRANGLAHLLRSRGVASGDVVGVCVERGLEMAVAVLGVLKAGAAYLPLDPAYPQQRREQMCADAGAKAVVSRNECQSTDKYSRLPLSPDAPAYLIYTSGSTGEPKGVVITHRALADKYRAWEREYRLADPDGPRCHLQMAAFPFDVCTGDLVRALLSGGRLVICPREAMLDPAALYGLMREYGVDCAEFLPSVARLLVDHVLDTGGSLDFMRLVAVGGEAWTPAEYARLRAACGADTRILNVYGVTEATIGNTVHELADPPARGSLPIGRPLPGVEAYVLDGLLRPVGPGVVGQIFLGGSGLATGYRGRPGLTAERFLPHPWVPGARLYATGDRGRRLADGTIEFLGRADHQVKIRGFRVELGEIEAVLRTHPDVADAAVAAPGDATTRRLVAYAVPAGPGRLADPTELRDFLRDRLPEHLVPGAYAVLDRLPRTASGKLDRNSLPEPAPSDPDRRYVAPRPGLEHQLAAIWANVLQVDRVGATDDFFQLGGHSLLAAQVCARVRAELGVPLTVRELLAGPTVEALARTVDGLLNTAVEPEPALVAVRRDDYRVTEAQFDGDWGAS